MYSYSPPPPPPPPPPPICPLGQQKGMSSYACLEAPQKSCLSYVRFSSSPRAMARVMASPPTDSQFVLFLILLLIRRANGAHRPHRSRPRIVAESCVENRDRVAMHEFLAGGAEQRHSKKRISDL